MLRGVALALTVLTGFSGLVYEVTWEKVLATLLGSHSEATAAVLGLFLGGLALGYALFGRLTRRLVDRAARDGRPVRLLYFYGFLEAGIGLYALLFPLLFQIVQALSFAIPHGGAGLGFALDVLLCALLIGPPAVLMGGTIPILTQALAHSLTDATRFHALVYGFNTAGAFAGALAAGFWIVPNLGLVGALMAMGIINLAAGAAFIVLGTRAAAMHPAPAPLPEAPALGSEFATCAAAALLIGFAMMTVQMVLNRLGALAFGASQFTFSMVVAVFVLCIAIGSLIVSALPRIPPRLLAGTLWALLLSLLLLFPLLADAPYWAHTLRALFRDHPAAFYPYHLAAFMGVLAVIGLPVALSGATLPLLFDHLRQRVGELGDLAGRLYAYNTFGSLLGALFGGYVLLFWLDLHEVFRLALAAIAVAAVLVTRPLLAPERRGTAVAALVPVLALLALLPPWPPERLSAGLFREKQPTALSFDGADAFFAEREDRFRLTFYVDDPIASIAVFEEPKEDGPTDVSIVTNGKPDSALLSDRMTNVLLALVPALLAERIERVFLVGYGTGATAGTFASLRSVREITVAEISPGVMQAAPFFAHDNGDPLAHPGTRVIRSDAYRTLMRSDERYDVIVSEPSNPWVTGVEMLYSREFLEAARDHLTPGGVHAQWFHIYETDRETVEMVLRTYASVFEHVAVWFTRGTDLLLLGFTDPEAALDINRIARRAARPDYAAALRRASISGLPALLAHELLPLGVVHATPLPGPLHALLHPRLSHRAGRAFFVGHFGTLPAAPHPAPAQVGARTSLLRRYVASRGGRLDESERSQLVTQTCMHRPRECVVLLAQWRHDVPRSAARARVEDAIRKNETLARTTNLSLVEPLSLLYGINGDASSAPDADRSLENAVQASERFAGYYHHGAPFSRATLAEIWNRCEQDGPEQRERCRRALAQTQSRLGDLGLPAPGAAGGG